MAETTGISWTRSTFNPWIGCTKVGPGCDHCYAEVSTPARAMKIQWGAGNPRRHTSAQLWKQPLKWNAEAARTGEQWLVFCASLADVFDNEAPQEWREELWALIEATPALTWQLVTKRAGNVMKMIPERWRAKLPANVWIIATMVNQAEFDRDWPKLREIPARIRGLSVEPMLGPITFPADVRGLLHWVIYGGESNQISGAARPCELTAIGHGIDQCRALGIFPFVKQLGSHPTVLGVRQDNGVCGTGKRDDPDAWPDAVCVQEIPA
jgi:protein gp37